MSNMTATLKNVLDCGNKTVTHPILNRSLTFCPNKSLINILIVVVLSLVYLSTCLRVIFYLFAYSILCLFVVLFLTLVLISLFVYYLSYCSTNHTRGFLSAAYLRFSICLCFFLLLHLAKRTSEWLLARVKNEKELRKRTH